MNPQPPQSLLAGWNPTVKLGTLIVAAAVVVFVTDPYTPAILWMLAVVTALWAGNVPWRGLALAHVALAGFALSLFAGNLLLRSSGPVIGTIGPIEITEGSLHIAGSLAIRTFYLGTISLVLVTTTDPVRLMTSLNQHAKLPAGAAYAVLAGMRVLEQLPREWTTIRCTQALREPHRATRAPSRAPQPVARAVFALLVSSVRKAERLSIALESRGVGSGPRTVAHPVALGPRDVVIAGVVIVTVAGVLVAGAACGWLTGPAALLAD